jgi:low affinity Fe/Cu permease
MERSPIQRRISRVLHWVDDVTSRSATTLVVVVVLLTFITLLGVDGFPTAWENGFATAVGSITLVMLFVIQHTQSRHQKVLQLKLDELIRTSPHADDLLVHIEGAADAELIEFERSQVSHHEALREGPELEIIEFKPDS